MGNGTAEDASAQKRQALLVVGMHRSGTSAVTRMLNLLGAALPDKLLPPAIGNQLGHWEPAGAVALHDEMLASAAARWDRVSGVDPSWFESTAAAHYTESLIDFLEAESPRAPIFAVKDPRMALFVPIWLRALNHLDIEPRFVLPFRHPLEVEASLRARAEQSLGANIWANGQGLLLWLQYVLSAEKATRNCPRSFIYFDALLLDWEAEANRLADQLNIAWPHQNQVGKLRIELFLDRDHKHENVSAGHGWTANSPLLGMVFDQLQRCVHDPYAGADVFDDAGRSLSDATQLFGDYVASLTARNDVIPALRSELHQERTTREHELSTRDGAIAARDAALAEAQTALTDAQAALAQALGNLAAREQNVLTRDSQIILLADVQAALAQAQESLTAREQDVLTRDDQIAARDAALADAQAALAQARDSLAAREQDVLTRDSQIAARDATLAETQAALAQARDGLAVREQDVLTRDSQIAARDAALADAQAALADIITQRNASLATAQNAAARLQHEISVHQKERAQREEEFASAREADRVEHARLLGEQIHTAQQLEDRLRAIETSTTWRMTYPLRAGLARHPRLRRFSRRTLKLVYWTVTLQLPRILRERRQLMQRETLPINDRTT